MSEEKDLYDVARNMCHEMGLPWYDPRTGIRYDAPLGPPNPEMEMRQVFQRQATIHAHAQTLLCPECGSGQNQIMNLSDTGKIFKWRCRDCQQHFMSGQE